MRRAAALVVQVEHVEVFRRCLRRGTSQHRVAYRARILLLRGQGVQPGKVAAALGCGRNTVWRMERRYREAGLAALQDRPRPGRPPAISPPAAGPKRRAGLS